MPLLLRHSIAAIAVTIIFSFAATLCCLRFPFATARLLMLDASAAMLPPFLMPPSMLLRFRLR